MPTKQILWKFQFTCQLLYICYLCVFTVYAKQLNNNVYIHIIIHNIPHSTFFLLLLVMYLFNYYIFAIYVYLQFMQQHLHTHNNNKKKRWMWKILSIMRTMSLGVIDRCLSVTIHCICVVWACCSSVAVRLHDQARQLHSTGRAELEARLEPGATVRTEVHRHPLHHWIEQRIT